MAKTRFPLGDIKSYAPAIEARSQPDIYLLEGKNFLWDSKGPKSGFGTRLLAQGEVVEDEGGVCQSIEIGTHCITFTNRGAYKLSKDLQSWVQILNLEPFGPTTNPELDKWTGAYLTRGIYFAHPEYGMFKLDRNGNNDVMTPMDQDTTPGLPFGPSAVAETNGRLIVLGTKYVGWSAPSAAENFVPALGGAGQTLLSDRITGKAIALAAFQQGFLVWTKKDCLLAEFIGGELVFRFDRLTTQQIPLAQHCIEALPDGSQIICTKQGIYRIENGNEPEQLTPIFNEFFRKVLEHEPGILVRLTYQLEADLLYVQLRDWTNHYVRTYALSLALDKWGIFSERHLGIIRWSTDRGSFGYVDSKGVAHKFVETWNREVTPHVFQGLDSSITVGYIEPPELHGLGAGAGEIDSLLEMQELFIGSRPSLPTSIPITFIDVDEAGDIAYSSENTTQDEIIDLGDFGTDLTFDGTASFIFAVDVSGSMAIIDPGSEKTRLEIMKEAVVESLEILRGYVATAERIDIRIVAWGDGQSNLSLTNVTDEDIDSLIAFINSRNIIGGTDFTTAAFYIKNWFDLSLASQLDKRIAFFITDGEPNPPPLDNATAAATIIEDLLSHDGGNYNTTEGTAVDIYGINIVLPDTTYTAMMDNTPQDGVPIVDSISSEALTTVIRDVLFSIGEMAQTEDINGIGFEIIEDEEDMNTPLSLLNRITYKISVVHEIDGLYDELITEPSIAVEKPAGILYTLLTSGMFHRVRLEANDDGEFFHVRIAEATMQYQGQLS